MNRALKVFGRLSCLALLLLFASDVMAQSGKISGSVQDANGGPLPGANVVIRGTTQGATTDADGYYAIINVTPGPVTLSASLVGYETVVMQNVVVIGAQTATVNFRLKESSLELSEMVVTAERPLVEMDKTTSKYTVTAEETERMLSSVRSTAELLNLQPGVSVDGSNRVRGSFVNAASYGNDVAYIVDGVRMNHNDGRGDGGTFTNVNRGAVQELSVLTGVTPAEYGNAQGGIVQIVTKDGGNQYNGWTEYRLDRASKKHWGANVYDAPIHRENIKWSDNTWLNERWPALNVSDETLKAQAGELIHKRSDYTDQTGWDVEGNISGPIVGNSSFVLTAKHSRLANPLPGAVQTGVYEGSTFRQTGPDNLTLSGSLSFKPTENMKLKVGGLYQGYEYFSDGVPDVFGKSRFSTTLLGTIRGMGDSGKDLFLPENWSAAGKQKTREELQYVVFTHTLSPKTFYEFRLSRSRSKTDTIGVHQVTTLNAKDKSNWFNIGREAARWKTADRQRYGFKFDLSSQVNKGHFLKTGLELQSSNIWMTTIFNDSPADRGLLAIANEGQLGEGVKPYALNLYVQDKMEFEGMIVNAGLRMDLFNANARVYPHGAYRGSEMFRSYTNARDYAYQDGSLWTMPAKKQVYFSPRLGVSHPITERAQFRFSSGVYYQWPELWFVFGEDYYSAGLANDIDVNKNGKIDDTEKYNTLVSTYSGQNGTTLLRPAKTTNFEVGTDWNFVSDYSVALTAYYKSEVEQFTQYPNETWQGARTTSLLYARTLDNGAYGDTRGLELSLKKSFSKNFSFNVSYNYQWASFTTGKRGNIIRNVFMDANTVAALATEIAYTHPELNVPVPQLWVEWLPDPAGSGKQIPKLMTAADIAKYGADSQTRYNALANQTPGVIFGTGEWDGTRPVEGELGQKGVMLGTAGYQLNYINPKPGDRRQFGSASFLASFPSDFQFGHRIVGAAMRNMSINMITRLETGGIFLYTPPQGGYPSYRELGMDSRTDVSVEKTFALNARVQAAVFMDMRNIFNQQDRTSPNNAADYTYYGLENPRVTDTNYDLYGDANDRTAYAATPRLTQFGVRLTW